MPLTGWKRLVAGRNPKSTLVRAAILAVVLVVVFKFILIPVHVKGISMEPTYHDGGVNFINRLAYRWGKPRRGDVVAVRTSGISIMFLKRIIGLPGETVAISKGVVLINGASLNEPYVKSRALWEETPRTLSNDEYFLIGDNRGMPQELHEHGRAKANRLVGKALW